MNTLRKTRQVQELRRSNAAGVHKQRNRYPIFADELELEEDLDEEENWWYGSHQEQSPQTGALLIPEPKEVSDAYCERGWLYFLLAGR